MTSIFNILCDVLNSHFESLTGKVVDVANICKDKLFALHGYNYGLRERIEQYLYILGGKNNKYIEFSRKTGKVKILKRIESKKLNDYL